MCSTHVMTAFFVTHIPTAFSTSMELCKAVRCIGSPCISCVVAISRSFCSRFALSSQIAFANGRQYAFDAALAVLFVTRQDGSYDSL